MAGRRAVGKTSEIRSLRSRATRPRGPTPSNCTLSTDPTVRSSDLFGTDFGTMSQMAQMAFPASRYI